MSDQTFFGKDGLISQLMIDNKQQHICFPRNFTITILGCTNKLLPRITCLVEQAEHHNLPLGIVINQCVATPKARTIPVIIININRYNIWVRQPLLAAKLYDMECNEIEYRTTMDWEGENIMIRCQHVPTQLINTNSCQVEAGPIQPTNPEIEKPQFGPRQNTNSANFNFKTEIDWLPFQLNIRKEASLMQNQQSSFINQVYDNKEVFFLHDEDLGYCDQIKHTIPTMMDKPVYLPHHTIPRQLQGEVCKCLDTWLCQGIMQPSKNPYAAQVVVVCKKLGEMYLCIDYHKLNSIMVRDAFPLPQIDNTLQAVHSSNWFMSFDLTQGYLRLTMEEDNIKKTTFRARFLGLYEFTCMTFGPEHQQAFDALKEALVTAPVLGYPDFKRESMLETDASLQGLGAVLSQQDETVKLHVIPYASWSLCPSERSTCNYSSAKLELLVLKWTFIGKTC